MGLLTPIMEKVYLNLATTYYGSLVAFRMMKLMITHGPRFVFGSRKWTRPSVLDDPSLGTHGYLHLDNIRLHYVASGPEDKPLMLFLHGFPEFWYSWRHQIREFQKDYRVVAIDQRGYGESDKPKGVDSYLMPKLMGDVKQVIEALGFTSCILVAHDWGGGVAWSFSRHFPDMVDKLIVMNCPPGPVFQKLFQTEKEQLKMSWYMFFFRMPYLPELFVRCCNYSFLDRCFGISSPAPTSMISNPLTVKPTQEDIGAYKYTFSQPGTATATINWYRAAQGPKKFPYDMKYDMPILLIWGMKDIAIHHTSPDLVQQMSPSIAVTRIPEAGHFVQFDTPDLVNKAMKDWLGHAKL